jgi:acyl-CoA reductase-like NAD-dependent aldehyde dehydrogenase
MHRAGLPVTLVSGVGSKLSDSLIRSPSLGALAFVGGRANGRAAATALADTNRRHMLEQEGLNAWGIWDFSQWSALEKHLRKGFEYGKQRCTAYPRYIVQRRLLPRFLDMYLPMVKSLRFGHPLAVEKAEDPLPELDFGPVISANKAADLQAQLEEALAGRALPVHVGSIGASSRRRTPRRTWRPPPSSSPPRGGRCTTPSRLGRSTPSCAWTPSRSSSRR